ncbi:MAG: hypothetical protein FWF69_05325, partial [Firmicutes bacterium]|nr:hypothetical protein [Bacillota bacterium]
TTGQALVLNEEKIREEEAMDGYYAIVTSERDESDDRIIDMYRGLWRIYRMVSSCMRTGVRHC